MIARIFASTLLVFACSYPVYRAPVATPASVSTPPPTMLQRDQCIISPPPRPFHAVGMPDLNAPGNGRLYLTQSDFEEFVVYLTSLQAWISDANACLTSTLRVP
jgi:hypothetical protein